MHRQHRVRHGHTPGRRDAGDTDPVGIVCLLPRHDPDRCPQSVLRGGTFEPRDDDDGLRAGAKDQHRQPLERHRLVPREVPQVGPDPDEQRVQPGCLRGRDRPGQPIREALLGDAQADGRHHEFVRATWPRSRNAVIVAGPSSNSLR